MPENTNPVLRIREFVFQKFPLAKRRKITDHDDLLKSGVIDSLGVLELVTLMQQEFSVTVGDEDLTPENFQTIERMAQFVARSLALQSGSGK